MMSPITRVLMLGAGFVARPALESLHEQGLSIVVACVDLEAARNLCRDFKRAKPVYLDVTNAHELDSEMAKVDLVISLIPFTFHVQVIESAIRNKKHMVTTSYISPAMKDLDLAARKAGIIVLNECGLDPGIDHLLAVKTVEEVHRAGGSIRSFRSYCGALPAPECADNPLGYKFSWSPRGVLLALMNSAKFYKAGDVLEIAGSGLMEHVRPFHQLGHLGVVAYPNRDSTVYRSRYKIPEAKTVQRNTLRYDKFPEIAKVLADIGFLDDGDVPYLDPSRKPMAWREVTRSITNAISSREIDLTNAIVARTSFKSTEAERHVIVGLQWIGLYSDGPVVPRNNPLDTLCTLLEEKLRYGAGERDMVLLQHQFEIEHPNGDLETRYVSITEYGDPDGHSALAKLVGIPCAIGVKKVLEGSISQTGVLAPLEWEVAQPLVEELKAHGIHAHVESSFLPKTTKLATSANFDAIEVA